ncbi:MAG: D-2-hydroxyacid dehydrogenase family protein [SAR202 cluster bacterium]|nr:D-2-hydroxyacid dehydrogenase family protein [SAR202 cluster bacterium]
MTRIAVLDDYQGLAPQLAGWKSLGAEVDFHRDTLKQHDALVRRLAPYDVLVTIRERTRFPAALLEALPNLKLIAGTGKRQANVNLDAATRLGIPVAVTNSPGDSTAELTWGLILALLRHIPAEDRAIRQGKWQLSAGIGLRGLTLGIMGLGRIGTQMATVGNAFGMRVVAWSRGMTPEKAAAHRAEAVSFEELFRQSDILTIHIPLSNESRGLVGAKQLALMKPTSYLINTSRGPIVDTGALAEALRRKAIAGAGVDVFDEEPVPADNPLLPLDNVVLTPHLGYATLETFSVFFRESVDNIRAWMAGEPVNIANPAALPHRRR